MAMAPTVVRAPGSHRGQVTPGAGTRHRRPVSPSLTLRAVPIVGSLVFVLVVVNFALWWDPVTNHVDAWWVPGDLWNTYFATRRVRPRALERGCTRRAPV